MNESANRTWDEIIEALALLQSAIVAREQYPRAHPAIVRADAAAHAAMTHALTFSPELVVAFLDGDFLVAERPFPDLARRLPSLAEALGRGAVECLVFVRGLLVDELTGLAQFLSELDAARRRASAPRWEHIVVRLVELGLEEEPAASLAAPPSFEPQVEEMLRAVGRTFSLRGAIEKMPIVELAEKMIRAVLSGQVMIRPRRSDEREVDLVGHTTNVAMMAAQMAVTAKFPEAQAIELTSAALVHDVGHLLLPESLRGVPEPLLDAKGKKYVRHHPFLGARALLAAGAPPLWIATSLDHHRGVDARGYPACEGVPHAFTRLVSVANYMERKRVPVDLTPESSERIVLSMRGLAEKYFDPAAVDLFVKSLGVFVPGTVVELTDGRLAIVVRPDPRHPLRPEVRILRGEGVNKRVALAAFDARERLHPLSIADEVHPRAPEARPSE